MLSPLRAHRWIVVLLAIVTASAAPHQALPARAQGLTPYVLVDQWPRDLGAPAPLIGDPKGSTSTPLTVSSSATARPAA